MDKQTQKGFEKLARMINRGFDSVQKQFDGVQKQFNGVDKKFSSVNGQLDILEQGQEEIILRLNNIAYRFELEALEKRVKKLELKLKS